MFTRIDHIMICVPDLERGMEQYRRMGFNVHAGGSHPGKGTHNAIALNKEDYLELLAIENPAEQQAAASWGKDLPEFIKAGGGIRFVVLQSDDLATDVLAMRGRGVDVSDAIEGSRQTPGGATNRWKAAFLGPKNPLPLFFIQHLTPLEERRRNLGPITHDPSPITGEHPNGVFTIERAYIVVHNLEESVAQYGKVLGIDNPRIYKGTVIMSHMAVFQYANTGLTIAHPYAPGPAMASLEMRGPGPFQALYRTTSMGAAARWMQKNGMPPPATGTRDTGEKAMLVMPSEACGAFIGFVGPE
jgi:hypothetical protein